MVQNQTSATELSLREYVDGDQQAILGLFSAAFGQPLDAAFWAWRFLDNPVDRPRILLAFDGSRLAAHYAVSPVWLSFAGRQHLFGLSMTTMTHADYRGLGLFPKLAQHLYAELTGAGYAGVYGFPNVYSRGTFMRRLGWSDLGELPQLRLPAAQFRVRAAIDAELETGWGAVDAMAALAADTAQSGGVTIRRDAAWLTWRFRDHPSNRYTCHLLRRGGELQGYAITKAYDATTTDMVDIVVKQPADLALLVQADLQAHTGEGHALAMWAGEHTELHRAARRIGFEPGAPFTAAGMRLFSSELTALDDPHCWSMSMADSDLY